LLAVAQVVSTVDGVVDQLFSDPDLDVSHLENTVQADEDADNAALGCTVSAWGNWSACPVSCGTGVASRARTATSEWSTQCTGLTNIAQTSCNTHGCPKDCTTGLWADWSSCSKTCGGGVKTRQRALAAAPEFGGKACPSHSQSELCEGQPCGRVITAAEVSATENKLFRAMMLAMNKVRIQGSD
jgi:hypothetical protein